MARISEEEINAVRNQADIVDVISHYLQVQKSGNSYKCICPFHDDHSPSMSISPTRQIYKCFTCGAGGNVFGFVQNYEHVTFPEAVGKVAELVGYHLSVQPEAQEVVKNPHAQALYTVLNETISYTMYQLDAPVAERHKEYLEKRGLDSKVRETFQIGYNPTGDCLTTFLKAKGYSEADLVGANVTRINGPYAHDVFADRILFPIHDRYGNPIGFSARTMDPNNPAKYINTNDTDIFTKGDIVYNYHRARALARKEGCVYVCEGVTDVIAFYRAGIENAVCTLGTSCTTQQIQLLKSIAPKIVFCYDGDHAGQAATWRAGKMALQAGCDIAIVLNQTGKDPDEIIRDHGGDSLKEMIHHEISWMEFVLKYLESTTNMDNFLEKKEMSQKAMKEIDLLQDEVDRRYFMDKLSALTGFTFTYTPKQLSPLQNDVETRKLSDIPDGERIAEKYILQAMMNYPAAIKVFEDQLGYLISEDAQNLAVMILDEAHTHGSVNPLVLMDKTSNQELTNLISELTMAQSHDGSYDEKKMDGSIRKVKISVLEKDIDKYKAALVNENDISTREVLVEKYTKCIRERGRLIDEENSEK